MKINLLILLKILGFLALILLVVFFIFKGIPKTIGNITKIDIENNSGQINSETEKLDKNASNANVQEGCSYNNPPCKKWQVCLRNKCFSGNGGDPIPILSPTGGVS